MMLRLRQIFCVHWFNEQPPEEYTYSEGHVICMQQRTYHVMRQYRACSKCGLDEYRRVGEPVYEGWQ